MNADFGRNIALLRKERLLSQKQAAADLNISQALLSHYEKGVRECSLDFVVKAADYYGVSADFLLGRTSERNGATLDLTDFSDLEGGDDSGQSSSLLPSLNKKIIVNTISLLYTVMVRMGNKKVISYVSSFLMLSVYKMFRALYSSNPQNPQELFSVDELVQAGFSCAEMQKTEARLNSELAGMKRKKSAQSCVLPDLSPDAISKEYPSGSSLYSLIQMAEKQLK